MMTDVATATSYSYRSNSEREDVKLGPEMLYPISLE